MNSLLLTVFVLGAVTGEGLEAGNSRFEAAGVAALDACQDDAYAQGRKQRATCLGPMPQSCYSPAFGCYTSTRFMQRYPAFHGHYSRSPYNYRHYFDYPWHAGLHEPTSHFSHHVPSAAGEPIEPPPPVPAAMTPRSVLRSASDTLNTPVFATPRAARQ